jgi:hypothetical protein
VHVVATAGHVDHGKSTLVRGPHRHRPRPLGRGEGAGGSPSTSASRATLPSGRGPRSSTCPATSASSATCSPGWGRRRLPVRGRRHRGLEAPVRGAPAHPRAARRPPRHRGAHQGRHRRRRPARAGPPRGRRARRRHVPRRRPVVAVDAPTGEGSTSCGPPSTRLLAATPTAADRGRPRLWIDRAFAARGGHGGHRHPHRRAPRSTTSSWCGPGAPCGSGAAVAPRERRTARARAPGGGEPGRGRARAPCAGATCWSDPGQWHLTRVVDARSRARRPRPRRCRAGAPTCSTSARASTRCGCGSSGPAIEPGDRARAAPPPRGRCRCCPATGSCCARAGRGETVGGGEILDVDPCSPPRARPTGPSTGWWPSGAGSTRPARAPHRHGRWPPRRPVGGGSRGRWPRLEDRLREAVADAGDLGLDIAGLDERDRAGAGPARRASRSRAAGPGPRCPPTPWPTTPTWPPSTPRRSPPRPRRGRPGRAARAGATGPGGRARRLCGSPAGGGGGGPRWPSCWPPPEGVTVARGARRPRHQPQVTSCPCWPPRRDGRHPPPRRPAHRRPAPSRRRTRRVRRRRAG